MEGYWQRVAEMGADDSPYRATFAQIICVAETDAEAERLYGPHVSYFSIAVCMSSRALPMPRDTARSRRSRRSS
jgi:hypothetical protein